jgi:hypothetical protein
MHATPLQPWNWIVLYNAQVSFFIDFTLQQVLLFQRRIVSYLHNFTLFVLKKKTNLTGPCKQLQLQQRSSKAS